MSAITSSARHRNAVQTATILFVLLVLAMAFCAGLHTVSDFDMGWQLATGRWVVQHHQIPRADVLSFTSAGQPWAYPPFAGVLLYLVYCAFGYAGLSWVTALACLGVVAYLVRRLELAGAVLAMLAVQSIAARSAPRADLFSTIFFAIFLGELWSYQRGGKPRLWLLPALMLLWVNLHPGFIAGLAVIGAYVLLEAAELPFARRRAAATARLQSAAPWLGATVVVTLLNPWGAGIYRVAGVLSGMTGGAAGKLNSSSFIGEYQGVPISTYLLGQLVDVRHLEHGFTWLLVVAVLLIVASVWRKQLGAAILLGVAIYAGVGHARYMALFAILVATLGPSIVRGLVSEWNATGEEHRRPLPESAAIAMVAVLCLLAVLHIGDYMSSRTYVVFGSDWRYGAGESTWLPEGAAAFIEREQLPGNIFEEYALGGFESFRLGPQYPDFLDGRSDRLRPDLVVEQRSLYTAAPDSPQWQKAADRWQLNVLLVAVSGFRSLQKMNPAAFCASDGWRAVYMDDAGMVFLRNTPQNKPWIDRLAINCAMQPILPPPDAGRTRLYDFYLSSGALYFDLNRTAEADAALQKAQQLFPSDPNIHLLLAGVEQRRGRLPQAEQEYLAALALNENSGARSALAGLYAGEGRLPEATAALEKAAAMSPQPTDLYLQLAEIELAQRLPAQALASYARAENASPFRNGGESLAPGLYAQIAEGRAEACRQMGETNEAILYQLRSAQLTPGNARRWNRLAEMYEAAGQSTLGGQARQRAAQAQSGTH